MLATSQEFLFILASPANQSCVADSQGQAANLLALDVSGAQHEPVLLTPGKWTVGAAASNQIMLSDDGVAPRQFLIIVTNQRSVIKDWSGKALWNGNLFDDAVLCDGDTVQIFDVRLTFRLAESLELISQLPCVAEQGNCDESPAPDVEPDTFALRHEPATDAIEYTEPGIENTSHEVANGMIVADDAPDRLDDLISRIESAREPERSVPSTDHDVVVESDGEADREEFESEIEFHASEDDDDIVGESHSSLNSQAALIDAELRQLEELRAAAQHEREELLAKLAVLAQETARVQSELEATIQQQQSVESDSTADSTPSVDGTPVASDESALNFVDYLLREPTADGEETAVEEAAVEEAAVTVEREKLRHYLEDFDSVNSTATEDENAVAVGAAHLETDYSLTNVLRSREEAVKQLDELVLAATQSVDSDGSSIANDSAGSFGNGQCFESNDVDGDRNQSASSIVEDSDASAPESENVDIEASVVELEDLIHEAESTDSNFASDDESDDLTAQETVLFSEDQTADTVVIEDAGVDDSQDFDEPSCDDRSLDSATQTETDDSASSQYSEQPTDSGDTTVENASEVFDELEEDDLEEDDRFSLVTARDITNQCEIIDKPNDLEAFDETSEESQLTLRCPDHYELVEDPTHKSSGEFASEDTSSSKGVSQAESIFDDLQLGTVENSTPVEDPGHVEFEPLEDRTP